MNTRSTAAKKMWANRTPEQRQAIALKAALSIAKPRLDINLVSPEGIVYKDILNTRIFAIEHNLSYKCLWRVIVGKRQSYAGWKLLEKEETNE